MVAPKVCNVEEPNFDGKGFYEMLYHANQPIYFGCRDDLSKLSWTTRMMDFRTDHNLLEVCMYTWTELFF